MPKLFTKMSIKISLNFSPNFDPKKRKKSEIKFIVFHYTGMKSEKKAIDKLLDQNSKVSCHYLIKNNGDIIKMVPETYQAWHAGISSWKKFKSLNKNSIGIEISNPGHNHGYKNFSSKQIFSLIKLLKYLSKKYDIKKANILGHSDIAPNRKKDPGEKFPWKKLAKQNLCQWHNLSISKIRQKRKLKIDQNEERIFLNNLYKIGYSKIVKKNDKQHKINLIKNFQRKFRQNLINGRIDRECLLISKNLVKS